MHLHGYLNMQLGLLCMDIPTISGMQITNVTSILKIAMTPVAVTLQPRQWSIHEDIIRKEEAWRHYAEAITAGISEVSWPKTISPMKCKTYILLKSSGWANHLASSLQVHGWRH